MSENRHMREQKPQSHRQKLPQPDQQYEDGLSTEETILPDTAQRAQIDPTTLSPGSVLQLQRTIGNRATSQVLRNDEPEEATKPQPFPWLGIKRIVEPNQQLQTKAWEGPADDYYDEKDEQEDLAMVQAKFQDTPEQVGSLTRDNGPVEVRGRLQRLIQRAKVMLRPLKRGDGWHENWFKKAFTNWRGKPIPKSIDSHPNSHGKFHAHIFHNVGDVGWGKEDNPAYDHPYGHSNIFQEKNPQKYEDDENYQSLDDAKVLKAVGEIKKEWRRGTYNVISRNCQHFVKEVIKRAQ